jgi:ABC-type transport system involved in multi-copper enzyme maturation permease subunit
VAVDWALLLMLSIVSLAGSYFDAVWLAVSATNRISTVAIGYATGVALGASIGLLLLPWLGTVAIGLYLLIPELGGALAAIRTLRAVTPGVPIRAIPRSFWPSLLLARSQEAPNPRLFGMLRHKAPRL